MTATIVLLSGSPGSGKTTLAAALAAELGWPRVNRDELYAGLAAGSSVPRAEAVVQGIRLFWTATAGYAEAGCSVIADATLYRDQSETDVRRFLEPVGDVRNVHCRSDLAYDRFVARGHEDAMNARVAANLPRVASPLRLGLPLLEVDTTDGYEPALPEIVGWVTGPR